MQFKINPSKDHSSTKKNTLSKDRAPQKPYGTHIPVAYVREYPLNPNPNTPGPVSSGHLAISRGGRGLVVRGAKRVMGRSQVQAPLSATSWNCFR